MKASIKFVKPLSQKKFLQFIDDGMTTKETKEFHKDINERFSYIVNMIGDITGFSYDWFDYSHDSYDEHSGSFSTEEYQDEVNYIGKFSYKKGDRFEQYDEYFPTSWFYQDFEKTLEEEKKQYIENWKISIEKKLKQEKAEAKKIEQIHNRIRAKLTAEDLKYIRFLSQNEVVEIQEKARKKLQNDSEKAINQFVKTMKEKKISVSDLYEDYLKGKKSPMHFNQWISKNMKKLEAQYLS